ncbi:hypothetical protein LJC15_02810 [Desulfovibrio sp. OttesenSCG-928-G11]|nr:hypothetical protein [Desulfovibrio sp. OttesenSCG-928-G11]
MQIETDRKKELRNILTQTLPPVIARHKISDYLGGVFSEKYLANLNSAGLGPRRIKFERKAAYLREDLIDWLLSRIHDEGEASDE